MGCSASAGLPGLRFPGLGGKKCPPKPETIKSFDLDRYLGLWYEQKRVPASFQKDTSCVRAEYGLNVWPSDKGEVTVYNVPPRRTDPLMTSEALPTSLTRHILESSRWTSLESLLMETIGSLTPTMTTTPWSTPVLTMSSVSSTL